MSKNNDFASIGDVYGSMLNTVKRNIVNESKHTKVKPGEIGEVPLLDGGPTEKGGYKSPTIDKRNKSKKENLYNIDVLSQDEDEETKSKKKKKKKVVTKQAKSSQEDGKMVKESINNFMRRKSIFDKLYENVMNPGPLGGAPADDMGEDTMDDADDLDALGIEDDTLDEEGGEVTLTLDRATAQQLCDMIQAALGEGDEDMGEDMDMEEDMGEDMDMDEDMDTEEDEEDGGSNYTKQVDYGKNNKVGNLKTQSGGASSAYTDKVGNDGDHGHALVNAKQPNMGKNNKVGSLKGGKSMFEQ